MIDPSLPADAKAITLLKGEVRLRSGHTSPTYFDKHRFEADPATLNWVAAEMVVRLPQRCAVLGGLELGGVPLAAAMSLATDLPVAFVRKTAKTYGTCLAVVGLGVAGKRVVSIEDVVTMGGAAADAARLVRDAAAHT